uniref:TonB-dependent receptor plug n=1 Tax=Caulobacter sp. (strain K31) TaxID=366602 RepID=B0T3R5_CAUSK
MSGRNGLRRALLASASIILAAGAMGWGTGAIAQDGGTSNTRAGAAASQAETQGPQLEEIVVQARRVEELQQAVPISISTVTANRLADAAASSVADIQRIVPSLQVGQDSSGQQNFIIRGSFGGFGNDPAVITYIDEVPTESRTLVYSLFDLGSVQVLKGSQGTLFGRNSTGGAVLFFNQRPRLAQTGGYLSGRYGNMNERRLEGAVNLPIGDNLAVRVSGQVERRDGLLKSVTAPGLDFGDRHNQALRASALWQPNDAIENYTQLTHYRQRENAPAQVLYSLAGPCTGPTTPAPVCLYQPPFSSFLGTGNVRAWFDQEQALPAGLTVNNNPNLDSVDRDSVTNAFTADLGKVSVRNIVHYGESTIRFTKDYDGTPVRIFDADHHDEMRNFYTETQLFGRALGDRLNWRVGGVYSHDRDEQAATTIVFPLPASITQPRTGLSDQTNKSSAAFVQGALDLSDWLRGVSLTAGYRHTWDDRKLVQQIHTGQPTPVCALQTLPVPTTGPVPFPSTDLATCTRHLKLKADDSNYNLTLDWKPTDKILFFVSSRRGYKAGSFNLLANDPALVAYAPEVVNDLEAGLKADWKIGAVPVRTNVSVFQSKYTNIQVSTVRVNPANGDISVLILNQDPATGLSNKATVKGFEVEVTAAPTRWLELSGFYSKTDSTYDRFTNPGTTQNLAGQKVSGVIPKTYGATVQAHLPLTGVAEEIALTASYYVRGAPQTNVTSTSFEDKRSSFDARLGLRNLFGSGAELAVFGKNLDDEIACPTNAAVTGAPTRLCGEGRTYGVELTYRFGGERR